MPAVKFIERLDLEEKFSSLDGHWLILQADGTFCMPRCTVACQQNIEILWNVTEKLSTSQKAARAGGSTW